MIGPIILFSPHVHIYVYTCVYIYIYRKIHASHTRAIVCASAFVFVFYGIAKDTSCRARRTNGKCRCCKAGAAKGVAKRGGCVSVLRRSFCRGGWQSIGEALTSNGWERAVRIPLRKDSSESESESGRFLRARALRSIVFFPDPRFGDDIVRLLCFDIFCVASVINVASPKQVNTEDYYFDDGDLYLGAVSLVSSDSLVIRCTYMSFRTDRRIWKSVFSLSNKSSRLTDIVKF